MPHSYLVGAIISVLLFRPVFALRARLMRSLQCLLLLLVLGGCASTAGNVGFNRYIINAPYGDNIPYDRAVAKLEAEATRICGADYRKVHDYDTVQGSKRILVWEVGCRGVERTDQRFGYKKSGTFSGP